MARCGGTFRAVRLCVTSATDTLFANVKCTNCGALIPINEALQHQLSEQAETRVKQEIARREQELAGRASTLAEREHRVTLAECQLEVVVESRVTAARAQIEETI